MGLFKRRSAPTQEPKRSNYGAHPLAPHTQGIPLQAEYSQRASIADLVNRLWERGHGEQLQEVLTWSMADAYALLMKYVYADLQTPQGVAAIDLFSSMVADLPVHVIDRNGNKSDPPRWFSQPQPNNLNFTGRDLLANIARSWELNGNAYIYVEYLGEARNANIIGLRPIQPERVRIKGDFSSPVYELTRQWDFRTDNTTRERSEPLGDFTSEHIVHVNRNTWAENMLGVSQGMLASTVVDTIVHRHKHAKEFFEEGAWKQIMLTYKAAGQDRLEDDEFEEIIKEVVKSIKARHNAFGVGIPLESTTLGYSASESQLVEAQESSRADIAAIHRTPPVLLSDTTAGAASYNSVGSSVRMYASHTIEPFAKQLEENLSRLLPMGKRFVFDVAHIARGDTQVSAKVDETLLRAGVASINEIREKWGLEEIDNIAASEPRLNRQFIPVSQFEKLIDAEIDKAENPPPPPMMIPPDSAEEPEKPDTGGDGDKGGNEPPRGDASGDTDQQNA